ncbi:hypothetical protein [Lysobacter gummosus]
MGESCFRGGETEGRARWKRRGPAPAALAERESERLPGAGQ